MSPSSLNLLPFAIGGYTSDTTRSSPDTAPIANASHDGVLVEYTDSQGEMSLEDVGEFDIDLDSHGGPDDLNQGGNDSVAFYSAVNASIHYELDPVRCISVDDLKRVIKSTPRRLPTTYPNHAADSAALYWMTPQTNRPAVVKLIGLLDTAGSHARIGPYFNMVNMDHITSAAFAKAKAVFEIRNLTDNDTLYSEEARMASQTVFGALRFLSQMQEKGRQPGATVNDIVYVNMSEDVCTISLHSDPIFKAPVEKKLASMDAEISLEEFEQLGKPGASSLVKPSAMLETVKAKAAQGPTSNGSQVHELPDPLGLYQTFIKANPDSMASQVVPPPFYDETNTIIPPAQYSDLYFQIPVFGSIL